MASLFAVSGWQLTQIPPRPELQTDGLSNAVQRTFTQLSEAAASIPSNAQVRLVDATGDPPARKRMRLQLVRYVLAPRQVLDGTDGESVRHVIVATSGRRATRYDRARDAALEVRSPTGDWRMIGRHAEFTLFADERQ